MADYKRKETIKMQLFKLIFNDYLILTDNGRSEKSYGRGAEKTQLS